MNRPITFMTAFLAAWVVTAGSVLPATDAQAQSGSVAGRAEALAALDSTNTMTRAEGVVWLAANGAPTDDEPLRKRLVDESPFVRGIAEQALWMLWSRSGDEAVDKLMSAGAAQLQSGEINEAIATYSEIIRRRPEFAEGWNKRATALFMAGELRRSLADCDEVIKRNPHHFGALSGYGQIYFLLEQYEKAVEHWKRALAVNPNMESVERSLEAVEKLIAGRRRQSV